MPFLRRARKPQNLTDYREAAKKVRERRRSRELADPDFRSSSASTQNPADSYIPRERLQRVERRVENLVTNAESIPRKWAPESVDPRLKMLSRLNLNIVGAVVFMSLGLAIISARWSPLFTAFNATSSFVLGTVACVTAVQLSNQLRDVYPLHWWVVRGVVTLNVVTWLGMVWSLLYTLFLESP